MEDLSKKLEDHEVRIRELEQDRAETKIYMKVALDKINEVNLKLDNMHPPPGESNQWSTVVAELIKLVTTCVMILGAIVGAVKILGK